MIEQLELTNFKNFRSAVLPLGKFTVIVGTNASGKSNLRDAFRFVHGISRGYSLAEIIGEKWGSGGERQWAGIRGGVREVAFAGQPSFTLRYLTQWNDKSGGASPLTQRREHQIEVSVSDLARGPQVISESLAVDGRVYLAPCVLDAAMQDLAADIEVQVVGEVGSFRVPRRFPIAYRVLWNLRTPSSASAFERWIASIVRMRFIDPDPNAMRIPSVPGQTVLGDRGENLSSVLLAICDDAALKAAVMEWIRQLTPLDVVDFEFEPDAAGRVLVAFVEGNGKKTSAYSASDGTLRFLAMLAALYGPNAAGFYFFDEIETGIHPTRLHLLIQLIERRCARGDVQVVATTHSPQLLGLLSDESRDAAVLCYRLEGHLEGRIKRIMDLPHVKDVLKDESLLRLHECGWFEDAVEFLEGGK